MAGPWEKYGGAPAPQQVEAPGVIMGRPRAPDPYRVQQDQISNANEAERLRLAQEGANISRQKDELDIAKKQREAAAGDMGDAIEAERKAAAFLLRALGSNRDYEAQDIGPRSWIGQKMADNTPDLLNELPSEIGNSPERQISDSAQDAFIAASLRQDSGAAIPPDELERQRRIYFPMPGDGPEVIAAKRTRRQEAIAGLKMSSGRLVDETLATFESEFGGGGGRPDQGGVTGPTLLPSASLGRPDPGINPTGVQDAASGGFSAIPEFRGMAGDVQAMIQQGASADQVLQYVSQRHADARRQPPNAEREDFIRQIVEAHRQRPDVPVSSLGQGWEMLEMQENPDVGGSLLGTIADSAPGAAAIGAADVVTGGFLDEISGALGGNTDNARAVMETSAQERPLSTFAGNVAGGAILPIGRAGTTNALVRDSAIFGGAYGAGSAEGDIGDRLTGGAVGAATGALAGYGAGKLSNALSTRSTNRAARQTERNALLQDFKDQGVTAMPANVGGAPTRVGTAGAGQAFFSSGSIRNAVDNQVNDFGEAIGRNAAKAGSKLPADEAGMLARQAGERFSRESSARGGRLYERAYAEAGDVKIVPQSAIQQLDAQISRLSQSPDESAAKLAKELTTFKGKLEKGVSIVGLRDARTRLSQGVYDGKLRSGPDQQIYRDVLGKVSDDIENGLRGAGKDRAANMFRTADKYWSERVDYIDSVLEPIVSKSRSGEDILASVESMATGKKGGVDRLRGLMRSLSDEERGNVQATIIDRLGKANKGAQNAEGDVFSPATFLTNWNGLSQKGKAALFGNSELRQSLDQIARVASSMKDAGKYTNTSNTAGALGWQVGISAGAASLANLPTAALAALAQYGSGKLLASPKFASWLARAPRNASPAQARNYVARLKSVAASEPVIAADVSRFAQFLNAANDVSPARAVAQGQQENN